MGRSDFTYSDGTFAYVPDLFAQLYTVHSKVAGMIVPLVYFLLPNKTRAIYERALRILVQHEVKKAMPIFVT